MGEARDLAMRLATHRRWSWALGMWAVVEVPKRPLLPKHTVAVLVVGMDWEYVPGEERQVGREQMPGGAYPLLDAPGNVGHMFDMLEEVSRDHKMMRVEQEQHTDGWRGWMVEVNGSDYYGESIGVALAKALLGQWGE